MAAKIAASSGTSVHDETKYDTQVVLSLVTFAKVPMFVT